MSQDFEKMMTNENVEKLSRATNFEEVKEIYKGNGIEISDEQAKEFIKIRDKVDSNPQENGEAFLDNVVGGASTSKGQKALKVLKAVGSSLAVVGTLAGITMTVGAGLGTGLNLADKLFGK